MVSAGKMPLNMVVEINVPSKTIQSRGDENDNRNLVSVRLLNMGNVSWMMISESNKAIRHNKNDSVRNWTNNCTRLPPMIFRMLISFVRALAFAMVRFT